MPPTNSTPLDMKSMVPLVTGGGSGIGLALVKEFLKRGSPKALITGRRLDILQDVAEQFPNQVFYKVSDAGSAADRVALLEWVQSEHPECNALVNNAGIMRRVALVNDTASWEERASEIEINLCGPVHLCTLFTPYLLAKEAGASALMANVTSGLAFIPMTGAPVYSATKAALHNYTMSLRFSLSDTSVRVVEIIPPAVKTTMNSASQFGTDTDEYAAATMDRIEAGELEVGHGFSDEARLADRATLDGIMDKMSTMSHTPKYPSSTSE